MPRIAGAPTLVETANPGPFDMLEEGVSIQCVTYPERRAVVEILEGRCTLVGGSCLLTPSWRDIREVVVPPLVLVAAGVPVPITGCQQLRMWLDPRARARRNDGAP